MITTQLAPEQVMANHSPLATACHFFLYNPGAESGFSVFFFNDQKIIRRRKLFFDTSKLYENHISVSLNKVLLEHSHSHSFIYCLWLLSLDNSRVE